ncbi:ABC transporter permease [Methylocella sp. CPCC 101449]|jgi:NitT/TauT family transport system permease protein|uniref:ABC transporter permease n=1 Tax=Methylocella sp. CPCC 101449 TaxID=2987531 RepID=UPI0028911C02|nr:ABC transporter permease [Methylocella sp. CPCC 101449]MDT2019528.1 ABC transporter permease [Methylocella sp. CPCC 101449]HEV2572280.1 ABC transporter permease [Beijerinckiaceae bacterium]
MVAIEQRQAAVARRRPRIGPRLSQVHIGFWRLLVGILLIAIWTAVAQLVGQNFIPTPSQTAVAAVQLFSDGTVPAAALSSLYVFAVGYLLAIVFAVPLGLLMGGFRVFGAALEPYVDALSAMPRVSFIPLIIIFLGLGYEAKICVVFLGAIMPILINTYAGVLNSDGDLIEMARSAGATDAQIFRKIMLPGAMPYIIAGMRVGAALALINTVVAELYTAVQGLGGLLSIYGNTFRMAPYFVVVFVLAVIGVVTMQSLKFFERRVMRGRSRD